MYPAINSAIKKLDAALKQKKGQLKANLHSKPGATTPEIAHEKIQEMDLSKYS
jgi:ribosome-associated translation inhibitor RaiA